MKRQPRTGDAAAIATALFDLSDRAMRDAARLAIIAAHISRGDMPRAHKALAQYITNRSGGGYAAKDARRLLADLESLCPQIGTKATKYRQMKEREVAERAERERQMAPYHAAVRAAVDGGMSGAEAIDRYRHLLPGCQPPAQAPDDEAGMAWARARVAAHDRERRGITPTAIAQNRTVDNVTYLCRSTINGEDGAA